MHFYSNIYIFSLVKKYKKYPIVIIEETIYNNNFLMTKMHNYSLKSIFFSCGKKTPILNYRRQSQTNFIYAYNVHQRERKIKFK